MVSFYLLVTLAALGAQPQDAFEGQEAGLSVILQNVTGSTIPSAILSAGAVISVFSVTLVVLARRGFCLQCRATACCRESSAA